MGTPHAIAADHTAHSAALFTWSIRSDQPVDKPATAGHHQAQAGDELTGPNGPAGDDPTQRLAFQFALAPRP